MEQLEVLKIGGLLATFLTVSLVAQRLLQTAKERSSIRTGLQEALLGSPTVAGTRAAVMKGSFVRRVGTPVTRRLGSLVLRFGGVGATERLRKRLMHAGLAEKVSVDTFLAASVAVPVVVGGFLVAFSQVASVPLTLWALLPISAMFPKMWLTSKVEARRHEVRLALSDTLDLLTIAVEAGLGFDAALHRVVASVRGPLSDELHRMLQELKLGIPRREAFAGLSERAGVQELDQFITAMNQADSFGVSIGRVLRTQADQLRARRSQIAEERAGKTPVKLLFPLLLCIFPGLFTVIVGPAAIQIMENYLGR